MKKTLLAAFVTAAMMTVPFHSYASASSAIVGTANGVDVTRQDADAAIAQMANQQHIKDAPSFDSLTSEQKTLLLKQIALQRTLTEKVKESGLAKDKAVKERLAAIETEFLQNEFLARQAKAAVTPEKIKARYDEIVKANKGKQEFHLQHILLATEAEADAIYKTLSKSPDQFSKLAKEKSQDKATADKGGDLGFIPQDSLPKEVVAVINAMKAGDISKPLKVDGAYHIIRLDARRPVTVIPFDQAKGRIEQGLIQQAAQEYLKSLLESTKVTLSSSGK